MNKEYICLMDNESFLESQKVVREMWDMLKTSVYNQITQNNHIAKLLDILQEKLADDKKATDKYLCKLPSTKKCIITALKI